MRHDQLRLFVGIMVSGTISSPSPGYFSPFPHGTSSLSVSGQYLALADSTARFPQGFRFLRYSREITRSAKKFSGTGLSPSMVFPSRKFPLTILSKFSPSETKYINTQLRRYFLTTPHKIQKVFSMVQALPFSLATTKGMLLVQALTLFSFPLGTEMFHFPRFATRFTASRLFHQQTGYPIRRSPDQRLLNISPRLIAVTPRPSSPPTPKASTICL